MVARSPLATCVVRSGKDRSTAFPSGMARLLFPSEDNGLRASSKAMMSLIPSNRAYQDPKEQIEFYAGTAMLERGRQQGRKLGVDSSISRALAFLLTYPAGTLVFRKPNTCRTSARVTQGYEMARLVERLGPPQRMTTSRRSLNYRNALQVLGTFPIIATHVSLAIDYCKT